MLPRRAVRALDSQNRTPFDLKRLKLLGLERKLSSEASWPLMLLLLPKL